MAKKLFLKMISPLAELKISFKDILGVEQLSIVGVKHENKEDSARILKEIEENELTKSILSIVEKASEIFEKKQAIDASIETKAISDEEASVLITSFMKELDALNGELTQKKEEHDAYVFSIVKGKIRFFKDVAFEEYEEDNLVGNILVKDTRKPPNKPDYWENPEECFALALDMYCQSALWRKNIVDHYMRLLNDKQVYEENAAGN